MDEQEINRDAVPPEDRDQKVGPVMASGSEKGPRDTLAIGVFAAMVLALLVVGYLALTQPGMGIKDFDPERTFSEWAARLESQAQDLLSKVTGDFVEKGDPSKEAKRHIRRGYEHYTKNRLDQALSECGKAIALDPRNPQAYYWRGRIQIKAGEYHRAMGDFLTAVKLKPEYREAHDNLGWLYEREKRYEEALTHLNKSIELASDNAWAYYHRAVVHYRKGDLGRALEDAKTACELRSQDGCRLYEEYRKKHGSGKT